MGVDSYDGNEDVKDDNLDDNGTDNVDEEDNDYNRIGVSSRIG